VDRRHFLGLGVGGAAAVGLGAFVGCGGGGGSGDPKKLKIISSLPRTGSAQGQTDTIVNGIKMAIEDFNGEVMGLKIEYEDKDDATAAQGQWDASVEASNAREAAADPDCMVFIGPYNSGAAKNSMPILNDAGLLQISPACTWPGLTKPVPGDTTGEPDIYRPAKPKLTFCRVCPNDFIQGPLSAKFAHEVLKVKQVFVLDDKELYGNGIAGLFKKECEKFGIKVLGHESINTTQQSFKSVITDIAGKKPDLLYFGGTSQSKGPQIAIDMKGLLNCPLMVPDGCYEKAFIDGAGADLFKTVTCYATIGGSDPAELKGLGAKFVEKYKEKYKKMPEAYAVYGYEACKVFLEVAKQVGKKDREELRKAVLAVKDFDKGVLGKWSFDADGDTTQKALTISKIVDGDFKPVHSINA
jgi:branched-chain amino acid transport system substrate-binding protein